MHNAPSVVYPVGRCAFEHVLYASFMFVTSCVWLAWVIVQPESVWLVLGAAGVSVAAIMGHLALRHRVATLSWDGEVWCLNPEDVTADLREQGFPVVSLDFQGILLLRWRPLSKSHSLKTRWLWLCRQDEPARWQDIRCAIYGRVPLF